MSTIDSGHFISIIQDNKYSIPVNVTITGQVLICQEASDKSCYNKEQVPSSKSVSGDDTTVVKRYRQVTDISM